MIQWRETEPNAELNELRENLLSHFSGIWNNPKIHINTDNYSYIYFHWKKTPKHNPKHKAKIKKTLIKQNQNQTKI